MSNPFFEPTSPEQQAANEQLLAELRTETDSLDVGDWPQDPDTTLLARYVRRRTQLEAELERVRLATQALIADLERRIDGLDFCYEPVVKQIVRRMLEGQKRKSIKTPWGTVGFRSNPGGLSVKDEALLMQSALSEQAMEGVAKMEWRLSKSGLNDYFKRTGDVPPGCDLITPYEKFYVG